MLTSTWRPVPPCGGATRIVARFVCPSNAFSSKNPSANRSQPCALRKPRNFALDLEAIPPRMSARSSVRSRCNARANDSSFALAASVWTGDTRRGEAVAKRLRAGAIMVNDAISYFAIAEAPHGGCGASGWGRTHGKAGLLEMVQTKYIDMDRLPRREKPWWYRYGEHLESAADAFLRFEFSSGITAKLGNARSALKTFFRDHEL